MHSIRFQFIAFITAILLVLLLLLNTYPLLSSRDAVFEEKRSSLSAQGATVASSLAGLDRLSRDSIAVDEVRRSAYKNEAPVELTMKEFDLILFLMKNPGRVYSREKLLDLVWGYDYQGDTRTVDVHIRRLREKLELNPAQPQYIITKWGVGYYLAE